MEVQGGFSASSNVMMPDGSNKLLADLKVGDTIKCVTEEGVIVEDKIKSITTNRNQKDILLVGSIICQRESRFYNPDKHELVKAASLNGTVNSSIMWVHEDKLIKIPNVIKHRNSIDRDLYCIATEKDLMFIIDEIIVK